MNLLQMSLRLENVAVLLASAFVLAMALGCGGNEDPRTIQIQGSVTLDGKPLKRGKISFTPDASQGNAGPMGIANIQDGSFNTESLGGRGVVGGPHLVVIENLVDAPGDGEEEVVETSDGPRSSPIPSDHREKWDIPKDQESPLTKDFDISS